MNEERQGNGAGEAKTRRLRFTASGWEYFRLWIVNVALTLLTLGIYSAWAKVRARRYLYGNVWLGNAAFDYTANPVAILRGRILVATVLVLLWVAQLFSIVYYYAALLALMPLVPWVVVRARSFQMRNSRHRGIALDFRGKYWDAAVWYPLSWAASIATLGLARPFTVRQRDSFLVTESRFGGTSFHFVGRVGPYYKMYLVTVAVLGVLYVGGLFALFSVLAASVAAASSDPGAAEPPMRALFVGSLAVGAAATLFVLAYLRTRLLSYRWSNTRLGNNEFWLELSFPTMLWLYTSNMAAIIATFGLFIPLARIRVLRYIVSQFTVFQKDGAETFEAGETYQVGATGAEAAGEFGLEIGI
jgi:uncharacterized membrane protein YjgN (DUF898 family)